MSSRLLPALAVALGVAGMLEALLAPGTADARAVSAVAAPLLAAPLAWADRRPVGALAAVALVLALQAALGGSLAGASVTTIGVLAVAIYCAGRYAAGRWALAGATVAAAAVAATRVVADPAARPLREALLTFAAVACPLLVGRWVRGQGLLQREIAERNERRDRMRTRDALHAAEEERARIAADLQLAVAGGLERVAAEAAALRAELTSPAQAPATRDPHPDAARERLARIAATARTALADVRRVLGVLRHEGAERRLAPPTAPTATPAAAAERPAGPAAPAPTAPVAPAPTAPVGRTARLRPALADALLAAAVLVAVGLELALSVSPVAALTAVPVAAPLLLRRRAPLVAAAATLAGITLQSALAGPGSFPLGDMLAMVAASYAIGAYEPPRRAGAGVLALAAGVAAHAAVVYPDGVIAALLGGVLLPWTVGRVVRGSRDLTTAGRRRSVEIEHGRAQEARAAVARERASVARELHDAVAHNVSVIAIQAAGAEPLVARAPERAAEVLELIEHVAGEALAELGRLGAAAPQDAPRPGLARVGVLAERARAAGIAVDVDVPAGQDALPAGVDLAAFRVVQEALANTAKHAGAGHAWVTVRRDARAVGLEIADDGRGPGGRPARDGGHGLAGMRERVALYGGTLETGAREHGPGFRVRATIPIDG